MTVSPNDYGFDYFFGTAASLDQPPYTYIENRNVLSVPDQISGVFPLDRTGASQQQLWQRGPMAPGYRIERVIDDMNNKVLELIDAHCSEPFFIYYPTHAVHGPLLPPKDYQGKSGLNAYGDMVLYVDHLVETVTEKLKEKEIWENTIFIFASDNGCSGVADYPLLLGKGHNPSYIFRGKKTDIYEGGHRIPAIISWPEHYEEGKVCTQMTCLSDLFATFAGLLDTDLPDNAAEDSISLVPALENNIPVRNFVVHSSGDGSFSVRTQDWKLELCRGTGSGMLISDPEPTTSEEMPYQLYHMKDDICEKTNVAADHADLCLEMADELLHIIQNGRSTPGKQQVNAGMEHWTQLEDMMQTMSAICRNRVDF